VPLDFAFIHYIQFLQWNGSSIFTIFVNVDIKKLRAMIKKTLLIFFFFCLSTSLLLSQTDSDIPLNNEDADSLQTSIGDSVPIADILEEKESLGLFHRFKSCFNFYGSGEIDIKKSPEELYATALDSSNTLITAALDSSNTLITTALDSSNTLITTAQDSSGKILENAKNKAKEITSRTEKWQKFLNKNSLLILIVLTLLVIVFMTRKISDLNNKGIDRLDELSSEGMHKLDELFSWRKKVNKNTIELPEVFISDWNKLAKSIELLTERIGNVKDRDKDKSLAILIEKIRSALPGFAEKININSKIGLSEVVDSLEPLKKQLELQKESNKQLKEGYDFNTRKRFTLELISIKDLLDHCLKGNLDKGNKDIAQISEKIERFFAKNGIYTIQHEGTEVLVDYNYKEHEKIDEAITADSSKEGKISGVKKIGYYFKDLEGKRLIIRRAKVSIYTLGGEKK
jgi:molecular chaperone GrpE (heat shock protein)